MKYWRPPGSWHIPCTAESNTPSKWTSNTYPNIVSHIWSVGLLLPHSGSKEMDTGSRWGSRRQCWTSRMWRRRWRCFCWVSRRKHRLRWGLRWKGIFFLFPDRERSANGCDGWTVINRIYTKQTRVTHWSYLSCISSPRNKGQRSNTKSDSHFPKILELLTFSQW